MIEETHFFDRDELALIREEAAKSELAGQFSDPLLQLIHQKQWLRTTIPLYCNGLEWELPKIIALFESLAYADGSVGWAVNLGSGANLFSGFLESNTAKAIYDRDDACSAGSGAITGTAHEVSNGYQIEGYWKYASGSAHATHFTGNAYLYDQTNEPILNETGDHQFLSFIVPRSAVEIQDSWNAVGLRASSSADFSLKPTFVPSSETFSLLTPSPFSPSPLYQFPFNPFSVASLAVMSSGIALHFIECFEAEILTKTPLYLDYPLRDHAPLMKRFDRLTHAFYRERERMFDRLDEAWDEMKADNQLSDKREERLIKSARKMADLAYQLVTELYRYCGMSAIFLDSELNKVIRDLLVASQHFMISPLHLD